MRIAALAAAAAARTTTTGTAPTAAGTAAAAASATGAWRLRIGNFDRDPATVQLASVDLADRILSVLSGVHFDEAKSARLTGKPVGDDRGREDVAALGEEFPQPLTRGGVCKTADVQLGRQRFSPELSSAVFTPREPEESVLRRGRGLTDRRSRR